MVARVELVTPDRYRRMPWRNGGGVTHEILIGPEGAAVDADFGWRLSIAEVAADGPFSAFDGCDRSILVIDGAGMALEFADRAVRLAPGVPLPFDGGAACHGRLVGGPVRDLNAMTRRGAARHVLGVVPPDADAERLVAAPLTVFVAYQAAASVALDGRVEAVPAGATLAVYGARRARVVSRGAVAVVSIAPR